MLTLLGALVGLTLPAVGVFRTLSRRRGARRNEAGCCAVCGQPWAARYPEVDQYVMSGQMICADCGAQLQRRLRRGVFAIGAVVVGVALATLVSNGFDIVVGNESFSWWHLFYWAAPVATFGAVAAVGAKRLRADNRAVLPRGSEPGRLPTEFIPLGGGRDGNTSVEGHG